MRLTWTVDGSPGGQVDLDPEHIKFEYLSIIVGRRNDFVFKYDDAYYDGSATGRSLKLSGQASVELHLETSTDNNFIVALMF